MPVVIISGRGRTSNCEAGHTSTARFPPAMWLRIKLLFWLTSVAKIGGEDASAFHEIADIKTSGNQGWSGLANLSRFAFYSPLGILPLRPGIVKPAGFRSAKLFRGRELNCSISKTKSK
jgi:hypothetical protein